MLVFCADISHFFTFTDQAREKADEENELKRLKEENHKLETTVRSLTREISELRSLKVVNSDHPSYGELKLDLIQTKQDLNRAKEALAGIFQCFFLQIASLLFFIHELLSLK